MAQSYTLDWDNLSWTPGATSGTFNDVDGSGVDVTISITGGTFLSGYPRLGTDATGGVSPAQDSLILYIDEPSRGQGMDVSVSFSQPVESLTMGFYDVDSGDTSYTFIIPFKTFRDKIVFNSAPTTLTGSANNSISGGNTALGTNPNAATSAAGNVYASYAGPTSNVSFFYGSGGLFDGVISNPDAQLIGFADFSFTVPIPEPSTYVIGALLCGLILWDVQRRRRFRQP